MARYEITGPDGSKYEVTAPEGASDADVMSFAQSQFGAGKFASSVGGATIPPVDPVADVVKSGVAGLGRGVTGLVGLPGTVEQLARAGINYGGKIAGAQGDVVSRESVLPSGQEVQQKVEKYTGPFYEPKTTAGEYARTVGEFAPGALFPGGVAQRVVGNVVGPALVSETAGQATKGTSLEPWARIAGAVAGGYAPNVVGRALTPAPSSNVRQGHVATLRNEGVTDLSAGQVTGANPLRYMEGAVLDTPGTGQRLPTMLERQQEQFTRAALRRAGVNSDRATGQVIDDAFVAAGQRFDDLAQRSTVVLNARDGQQIDDAINTYRAMTPPSQQIPILESFARDMVAHAGAHQTPGMGGAVYQRYHSLIERAARGTQDPEAARALRSINEVLDDAVARGLPPAQRREWQEARGQYRNLLTVSRAAGAAGENAANGFISPAQLAAAAKAVQTRRNFERGRGELARLARSGEAVMKQMPQSGTAPRLMAMQIGQTVAGGAAGALAGSGDPTATTLGALAPFVIRGMLGRGLMHPATQRYLSNQALPGNAVNGGEGARIAAAMALAQQPSSPLEVMVYPPGDPRNR